MVMGIMLVNNSTGMTMVIVQLVGALFICTGLAPLFRSWLSSNAGGTFSRSVNAIGGTGSILLGCILLIFPGLFVTILMYVLGAILVLAGLSQIRTLSATSAPWWLYVTPAVLTAAGFFVLFRPLSSASLPFVILGVGCIGYAVSELFIMIRLIYFEYKNRPRYTDYEEVKKSDTQA